MAKKYFVLTRQGEPFEEVREVWWDLLTSARLLHLRHRETKAGNHKTGVTVLTNFEGMSDGDENPPLLWVTIVLKRCDRTTVETRRYSTHHEAFEDHDLIVAYYESLQGIAQ